LCKKAGIWRPSGPKFGKFGNLNNLDIVARRNPSDPCRNSTQIIQVTVISGHFQSCTSHMCTKCCQYLSHNIIKIKATYHIFDFGENLKIRTPPPHMKIFSIFSCLLFSIFGALILPPLDFFYFLGHFFIVSLKAVLWISKGSFPSEIKSTMLDISDISETILHQLYQFYSMFYYIVHWYPFLFIFFSIVDRILFLYVLKQ